MMAMIVTMMALLLLLRLLLVEILICQFILQDYELCPHLVGLRACLYRLIRVV